MEEVNPNGANESTAFVENENGGWVVATSDDEQLEQNAGELVTWDGSDAIGKLLSFTFDQKIFVGDLTEYSFSPSGPSPARALRLKRAHALPPPPDETGYRYDLKVDGQNAGPPSSSSTAGTPLRARPRIRVKDVEVLPDPDEDRATGPPPATDPTLGLLVRVLKNWLIGTDNGSHIVQHSEGLVTWDLGEAVGQDVHILIDPPIFEDDRTVLGPIRPTAEDPYHTEKLKSAEALPAQPDGGFVYDIRIGNEYARPLGGSEAVGSDGQPERARPRIRVSDVPIIDPGEEE